MNLWSNTTDPMGLGDFVPRNWKLLYCRSS